MKPYYTTSDQYSVIITGPGLADRGNRLPIGSKDLVERIVEGLNLAYGLGRQHERTAARKQKRRAAGAKK